MSPEEMPVSLSSPAEEFRRSVLLGAAIPPSWSLDFSIALTFIAIVVPALRKRSDLIAALTTAAVAVLVALFTRNGLATITAGMAALRLVQYFP